MSEFYVGQKVVCVDDTANPYPCPPNLRRGTVYTIYDLADFTDDRGNFGVKVEESIAPKGFGGFYRASRFHPLEYKAMQIFRSIAANPTIKIQEDA